jgi:hypothetical protein
MYTLESSDIVAPELGFLGQSRVVGVEVKVHLAQTGVGHRRSLVYRLEKQW